MTTFNTQKLREEWEIMLQRFEERPIDLDKSIRDIFADWWISKIFVYRIALIEELDAAFNNFLLQDWSGEAEVYEEIYRLKKQVIDIINKDK